MSKKLRDRIVIACVIVAICAVSIAIVALIGITLAHIPEHWEIFAGSFGLAAVAGGVGLWVDRG